ncbi:hypothetical protein H6G36_04705 [Anabaena minutissima FACHB-250]|nr:hypothetical protein [Anabaena minutissima FACHB-250]
MRAKKNCSEWLGQVIAEIVAKEEALASQEDFPWLGNQPNLSQDARFMHNLLNIPYCIHIFGLFL